MLVDNFIGETYFPFGRSIAKVGHILGDERYTAVLVINNLSVRRPYISPSIHIAHAAAYFCYDLTTTYRAVLKYDRAIGQFFYDIGIGRKYNAGSPFKTVFRSYRCTIDGQLHALVGHFTDIDYGG